MIHRYGLQEPLPSRPQRFLDETNCSEFMAHEECWGEMIRNRKSLHKYFKDTTDFSVDPFARIK
ncbi:hypothetical protein [Kurthia sibirica]|uniref:Uncharacterized protein n=1 Tax=Kurthia sibirica TaxID=202750 RepID=A0A2U3AGR8_9BACL|nr:hypothetical protein [Kurthia sibirica]PWI23720.1 hypothetical protein DEX24_15615 [Kurthia sibirica]GEK35515.1 hypothetical protein KSI01_30480 [Kurthia sibirica]